jgi:hypothetical protein
MKKGTIIGLSVGILIAVTALIIFSMSISYSNTEIDLRTTTVAQQDKCKAYFDKMWKILQQKAGVADQYKEAFKEIYPKMIEGRYSKGDGSLMKWITESNPQFDVSLYKELMQSIEIERTGYFNEQSRLIDMQREHAALLQKAPSRWFLNDTLKPVAIIIVTSKNTKDAYVTGEENEVDLFKKDAKDTTKKK